MNSESDEKPLDYAPTPRGVRRSRPVLGTFFVVLAAAGYSLLWYSLNRMRAEPTAAWYVQVTGLFLLFMLAPGVMFLLGSKDE